MEYIEEGRAEIIQRYNKKRLEGNGYSVYEPNLFKNYYVIRWVEQIC